MAPFEFVTAADGVYVGLSGVGVIAVVGAHVNVGAVVDTVTTVVDDVAAS
jgi:hypothetical protein